MSSGQCAATKQPAEHSVAVSVGMLTARAAFSHVPFWQSLAEMATLIAVRPVPGNPVIAAANQVPSQSTAGDLLPHTVPRFHTCAVLQCLAEISTHIAVRRIPANPVIDGANLLLFRSRAQCSVLTSAILQSLDDMATMIAGSSAARSRSASVAMCLTCV